MCCKRFSTRRRVAFFSPALFFHLSWLLLEENLKSAGIEASHFVKTSHLPKCLMMRPKSPADLLSPPNVVVTSNRTMSSVISIQTLKIHKSRCIMGNVVVRVCQAQLVAQIHTGCISATGLLIFDTLLFKTYFEKLYG